jgi:hypothetical protein
VSAEPRLHQSSFAVGDGVVYTAEGYRVCKPPRRNIVGVVTEVEPFRIFVRWPGLGLACELPEHIAVVERLRKRGGA